MSDFDLESFKKRFQGTGIRGPNDVKAVVAEVERLREWDVIAKRKLDARTEASVYKDTLLTRCAKYICSIRMGTPGLARLKEDIKKTLEGEFNGEKTE